MTFFALKLDAAAARHLGFNEAVDTLHTLCASPFGKEALEADVFPSSLSALDERLDESMEAKAALERKVQPPFAEVRDVRPHLAAAQKGVVLGAPDLLDVGRTVDALARLRDVLTFQGDEARRLADRAALIADERRFARRLLGAFDEQGLLKDDASPELAVRRGRVRVLREEVHGHLAKLVRSLDEQGYLRDRNFTVRNDRYVLPVRADVQGLVEGIVHDASQTHQTVYIEPRALLELGNRIKIARAQVTEEEERILAGFSTEVAERALGLASDLSLAGELEAAFARGAFAKAVDGKKPRILESGDAIWLRHARHPLLSFRRSLQEGARPLVDNDIGFGSARVLVVSGPNGGGKTVALTTAGLNALLVRAGVPIPVAEDSTVPCFERVVCAMAGDQSLDAGLSTFQAHLVELRTALEEVLDARGPVLCLIDEICSGTDPAEGAALAQAVLEKLSERARVIVTTHFERLKTLAIDPARGGVFRNASFALSERGRPTFQLVLDQAGTSRALAAATDKGIPADVLARAEELVSPDDKELAGALRVLSEQKDTMRTRLEALEQERASLVSERETLERRLAEVERESQRLRREGKKAFLDELKDARRIVAEAIEAAKGGAGARDLDRLSHELRALEARTVEAAAAPPAARAPLANVAVGAAVELHDLPGVRMNVLEIDGDEVVVGKGALKRRVRRDALRAPGAEPDNKKARNAKKRAGPSASAGAAIEPRTADNSLDVRGMRADEALERVDVFLDRMMKEDRARAFILHGHGGGALKQTIRKALSTSRYAARHQPADNEDGGDAWTVVTVAER